MSHNKKFVFEISIEAEPYNKETCDGYYNPDFPEHTYASMEIGPFLQDCVVARIRDKMDALSENNYKERKEYLDSKIKMAEAIRDSLKFVRVTEI